MEAILAATSVGISELKQNPSAVLEASKGQPVAVLNRNKPIGYFMTAALWEQIHEVLDDRKLLALVDKRRSDGQKPIKVKISDL